MVNTWVTLQHDWPLQDVQAALTVIIAFISTGLVFAFVRLCWQHAAQRVLDKEQQPLYSVLSLNTIGEVFDITILLRQELLLSQQYRVLLYQSFVVVTLATSSLFSGFIARALTRESLITVTQSFNGILAARNAESANQLESQMGETIANLDRANFTLEKLLDYYPYNTTEWLYVDNEWNSTWTMSCVYTLPTLIDAVDTGNCTTLWTEVPELERILGSYWQENYTAIVNYGFGIYTWDDTLLFLYARNMTPSQGGNNAIQAITLRLTALHLLGAAKYLGNSTCWLGRGQINQTSYTDATCNITRQNSQTIDNVWGAFPDSAIGDSLVNAIFSHYTNTLYRNSYRHKPIPTIQGTELVRFYQSFMVLKDTLWGADVTRALTAQILAPQISLPALVVCCIGVTLVIASVSYYSLFLFHHRNSATLPPQSKLDWVAMHLTQTAADTSRHTVRKKLRGSYVGSAPDPEQSPLVSLSSPPREDRNKGFEFSPGNDRFSRSAYVDRANMESGDMPAATAFSPLEGRLRQSYPPLRHSKSFVITP